MKDPSLKGTDFPLSSTEKTSNSTMGMHHFALSRETSCSFSSRQRNLNESGYSSALFRLGTSFHDSINVMVPGCGKLAGRNPSNEKSLGITFPSVCAKHPVASAIDVATAAIDPSSFVIW
jgi:hypothetical protein